MTYEEALQYIHSVTWKGSRPGLERISVLCELLGHPEKQLKFIHVAGTNGKGSTCRMLSSILEKAGYRVGLYTSPFIERFNERIMLNGCDIPDEDLARDTETVKRYADTMEDAPTEFELITAIAFVYYARVGCDFVVLECGLGGRLDSTNVIDTSVLSVITGIDMDHTAILGDTPAKIAAEKAGIIKPGVPVLFGEGVPEAEEVIRAAAEAKGSPYTRTDFTKITDIATDLTGTSFRFGEKPVKINLHGIYQTRNTATVLTAVEILRQSGVKIPDDAVDLGLLAAQWKARFEILADNPLVIYDGAHNPQGIAGAVENIAHYLSPMTADGKVNLLMGVMADKDHEKMISMLAPYAAKVFTVMPPNDRSLASTGVEMEFEQFGTEAEAFDVLDEGVFAAVEEAARTARPLVCLGSLYMYADVKKTVHECLKRKAAE
ncbi:MAG: bifunctional folylpolyglutamate synthase/dihydrofolate synthase [Clostridia bacterium]|nr:bifunctional folylpolyglutamate synthase/dihydrofolate synthase [Clostridia bacterium]